MGSRFSIIKHPLHCKRQRHTQSCGFAIVKKIVVHRLEVESVIIGIGQVTTPQRE